MYRRYVFLSRFGMGLLLCCMICVGLRSSAVPFASAADWPQWRGPKQDNLSTEKGLLKEWPKSGPKLAWKFTNAGEGYACPVVVGDRVYLGGTRDKAEVLIALEVKDGQPKELWTAKLGPIFQTNWNAGPTATPTVDGANVYALSSGGDLVCVTTEGKELWRKSMHKDFDGAVNPIGGGTERLGWGYSASPVVDGDKLIIAPGGPKGTLAALDKKTGQTLWQSKELTEMASYSTPVIAEVGGIRHYVILTNAGVAGIAPKDGSVLWNYKRKPAYGDVVIPTPIVHDGHVFVTVGHGGFSAGCDLIKITAEGGSFKAEKVYGGTRNNMVNQQGGVVLVGGHVYGYSDKRGWTCLDFKTGKDAWSERDALGAGSVTYADGHLYLLSEVEGTAVLAEASPVGWKEKGRFELPQKSKLRKPSGKVWTQPVIANGKLYLRDQELLFVYDIK